LAHCQIEERIVQRGSERILASVGFPTASLTVVMIIVAATLLINAASGWLASIPWRFSLSDLQVKA
jgi:hypothetical protein